MRTTFLITVFALVACTLTQAQILLHPTPVSAGGVSTTSSFTMRSSLGQAFIGRPKTTATIQGVGFWYRPQRAAGATVAIPATEGEIGTRVSIPVMLTQSSRLVVAGPRGFTIKVRYNNTVLVYKGAFPVTTEGGENIVTITGTVRDTVTVLADLDFLVTLGNAERTDMIIDDVQWQGTTSMATDRVNGIFQALGVCKEGDIVRLIHRKSSTAITGIAPQPAIDNIDVNVILGTDGPMSLHIIDLAGTSVAMLVYDEKAKAGKHSFTFDISHLISGSYYMVMQTSHQLHTATMIVRK